MGITLPNFTFERTNMSATNAPRVEELAGRLDRLERAARRWKFAAVGLAVVVGVGVCMGADDAATTPKVVKAQSFVIENADGKQVGRFGVERAEGEPDYGILILGSAGNNAKLSLEPGMRPLIIPAN
ncbi:MAG: hypothetical protein C0483_14110 [Pirellula sp.]|nr:hypothetical protein [Pirellula sp.]